jgi:hypothetical protein
MDTVPVLPHCMFKISFSVVLPSILIWHEKTINIYTSNCVCQQFITNCTCWGFFFRFFTCRCTICFVLGGLFFFCQWQLLFCDGTGDGCLYSVTQSSWCLYSVTQSSWCLYSVTQSSWCLYSVTQSSWCLCSVTQSSWCLYSVTQSSWCSWACGGAQCLDLHGLAAQEQYLPTTMKAVRFPKRLLVLTSLCRVKQSL